MCSTCQYSLSALTGILDLESVRHGGVFRAFVLAKFDLTMRGERAEGVCAEGGRAGGRWKQIQLQIIQWHPAENGDDVKTAVKLPKNGWVLRLAAN